MGPMHNRSGDFRMNSNVHEKLSVPMALAGAVIGATLMILLTMYQDAHAIGPVNIPGPLHPDPLAMAVCGGVLDDYVVGRTLIVTADEGEGRTAIKAMKWGCRQGFDVIVVGPEFWGKWMYGPYKPSPK